ncbi:shikimate dehydrogenase [Virgibacillus ainsalahensis]
MIELFGVMGNPIKHSLSPLIQNEAYELNNINAFFQPFQVESKNLEEAVKGMKALGIKGFMVTVPFKAAIIPYLDELSPGAEKIRAVNVVQLIDGKYVGYNFDGEAWLKALKEDMKIDSLKNQNVLLLGAGGAAQSIYYTLAQEGNVNVDISNRTMEKAEALVELSENKKRTQVISLKKAESQQEKYDVIVQTTSIGMWPKTEHSPIKLSNLKKGAFVSDIIYNPGETEILRQAKNNGAKVQNGMKMLASQNVLCIEKWTGHKVDSNRMLQTLKEALNN